MWILDDTNAYSGLGVLRHIHDDNNREVYTFTCIFSRKIDNLPTIHRPGIGASEIFVQESMVQFYYLKSIPLPESGK